MTTPKTPQEIAEEIALKLIPFLEGQCACDGYNCLEGVDENEHRRKPCIELIAAAIQTEREERERAIAATEVLKVAEIAALQARIAEYEALHKVQDKDWPKWYGLYKKRLNEIVELKKEKDALQARVRELQERFDAVHLRAVKAECLNDSFRTRLKTLYAEEYAGDKQFLDGDFEKALKRWGLV